MVKNFKELPTYDRIQALVRDEQYLSDLRRVQAKGGGIKRIRAEKKLCEKYGLFIPITEEFAEQYSREQLGDTMVFEDVDPVVSIIPVGKFKPATKTVKVKGKKTTISTQNPGTYILRKGRFLTLEIDLQARDKDIERIVKKRVSTYKSIVDKDPSHDKKGEYEPWEVWDMHEKEGLSLVEIARRKSGLTGNPTFDDRLRSHDRKVRRAYDKTCSMIQSIKK